MLDISHWTETARCGKNYKPHAKGQGPSLGVQEVLSKKVGCRLDNPPPLYEIESHPLPWIDDMHIIRLSSLQRSSS